jgi:quinol monooxygenase YgiN
MYIRLVQFTFGPGMRSKVEELAAELGPAIEAQDGCNGVTFFGDDSDGEYGLSVLWESQENADAAAAVISPKLQRALAGNVQGPPSIRLYEVISS